MEAGEAALNLADFKQALALFLQAYDHLPENIRLLRRIIETTFILEGYDTALVYLNAAQNVAQSDTERLQLLLAQASILYKSGLYDEAQQTITVALPLARQVNDNRLLAEALYILASINTISGQMDEVVAYLDEALVLAQQSQDTQRELLSINIYGVFYSLQEDYQTGLDYFEQQLALAHQVGNRDREAGSLNNMAEGLKYIDYETHQAKIYNLYEQALLIAHELGDQPNIALYESNLAEMDIYNEAYSRAQARLRTILQVGLSANILKYINLVMEQYVILLLAQGDIKRGLTLCGLMRQQQTWMTDTEQTLQSVLRRYHISQQEAEAGVAAAAELDYEETLAQIQAELAEVKS